MVTGVYYDSRAGGAHPMGFRRHRTGLECIAIVMYREDPIGSYSINILVPILQSLLVSKADLLHARTCASPVSDKNSPRS